MAPFHEDNPFAALLQSLDHLNDRAERDREERLVFEREMRAGYAALSARIQSMEADLKQGSLRLEHIEPVVATITSLQARVTGGMLVLGILGGIAWGGVMFFKERLLAAIGG